MTQELKTIKLYGALGERFGRVHRLAVANAAEAVRALISQIPGFRDALEMPGSKYHVRLSGCTVDAEKELHRNTGGTISLVPEIAGAKKPGLFQAILGIVLIAVAWWNPAGWTVLGASISSGSVMMLGASMLLGGVVQMLSPVPKMPTLQDSDTRSSHAFGSIENTTQQGLPVPVVYGEMLVGSRIVSIGTWAEALPV